MAQEIIYAPFTGTAVPMTQVPDPAFSENHIGQGVAVQPADGVVVSPADGVISALTRTNHAFCVTTDAGTELLIHIGIDTVKLEGKGFKCYVQKGQRVRRGDKVMKFDLRLCQKHNLNVISPCVVISSEEIAAVQPHTGPVKAGQTPILTLERT